jgi:hypothetical protein
MTEMKHIYFAAFMLAAGPAVLAQTTPSAPPASSPARPTVTSSAAAAPAVVSQREVSGVKLDNTITLGGQRLTLNGAGVRYKTFFKVYVGSLYATRKFTDLQSLVAAPGPKRFHAVLLRDVETADFGRSMVRGIEDNTPKDQFFKFAGSFTRMSNVFSDKKGFKVGETFSIDFLPGVGTIVSINGKPVGEPFKEPEFFQAMMGIWIGSVPADFKLKEALLNAQG